MVTVNGVPAISASTTATVQQNQATAVTGVSVSATGNTTTSGETFTAVLTDTGGVLSATTSAVDGGGTITPSNGGTTLTISGSLAQLNADLTTLTDNDATTAADTVTINAKDSFGNSAASKSIAVTINGLPPPLSPTLNPVTPNTVEKTQTTVIGTVTPGVSGDPLTLTETSGAGTLRLGAAQNGIQQVIYTAPASIPASTKDVVSYQVKDQKNGTSASLTASVQLDAGPSIALLPFVPGAPNRAITIATAAPGLPTDTLSLVVTQAPQSGTVTLHGTSVQFTPTTSSTLLKPVTFSFDVKDQLGGTTPVRTVIVGGDLANVVTGNASGNTDIGLGNGLNVIKLAGSGNVVDAGVGADAVSGGVSNNTVILGNGLDSVNLSGGGNAITLGNGADSVSVGNWGTRSHSAMALTSCMAAPAIRSTSQRQR